MLGGQSRDSEYDGDMTQQERATDENVGMGFVPMLRCCLIIDLRLEELVCEFVWIFVNSIFS